MARALKYKWKRNTTQQYIDIHKDFLPGLNSDIQVVTEAKAIEQQISGIIMTKKGEAPLDPEFGCDLQNILFDNMNSGTAYQVAQQVLEAIQIYEPRVENVDVKCNVLYDTNQLVVTIKYTIKNINQEQTLEYELS